MQRFDNIYDSLGQVEERQKSLVMKVSESFKEEKEHSMPKATRSKSIHYMMSSDDANMLLRVGNSGWIGYNLFCEYSSVIDGRSSRIASLKSQKMLSPSFGTTETTSALCPGPSFEADSSSMLSENQSSIN